MKKLVSCFKVLAPHHVFWFITWIIVVVSLSLVNTILAHALNLFLGVVTYLAFWAVAMKCGSCGKRFLPIDNSAYTHMCKNCSSKNFSPKMKAVAVTRSKVLPHSDVSLRKPEFSVREVAPPAFPRKTFS